jgi:hypothetical protein
MISVIARRFARLVGRRPLAWALLAPAVLLGACTGVRESREVARVSLVQAITYEQLLDDKVHEESAYYARRVATLMQQGAALSGDSDRSLLTRASQDFQSEVRSSKDGVDDRMIRDNVDRFLDKLAARQTYYETMTSEFTTILLASIESLEVQKAALQRTRKALEELQREPGTVDEFKRLFKFAVETRKEFERSSPTPP